MSCLSHLVGSRLWIRVLLDCRKSGQLLHSLELNSLACYRLLDGYVCKSWPWSEKP